MEDEIDLDIRLQNPTLQARKKLEVTIMQGDSRKGLCKGKIKINTQVEAPKNHQTLSKGKSIPGIDS